MSTATDIAKSLKADGQAMMLTRVSGGVLDPVAGTITGEVTQTWSGESGPHGLILAYKDSDTNAPNSLILAGDEKILLSANAVRPLPGDVLTIDSENYKVISVKRKRPQGPDLLYYVQCRK